MNTSKPVNHDFDGQGYEPYPWTLHGLQHAVDHRSKEIDPRGVLSPLFFATEFAGEAGEACNVVKKIERELLGVGGRRDTPEHLGRELADTIITACNIARYYELNLTFYITEVFNETSKERNLTTFLKGR